jgi:hypothetical protein
VALSNEQIAALGSVADVASAIAGAAIAPPAG